MSELTQTIKELYKENISDGEVDLAKDNLVGFFKLLQEIDTRLQKEEQTQQKTTQNGIQSILQGKTTRTNKQSSKSNRAGLFNKALAILTLCFCPPDKVTPRSPTIVS